MQLSLEEAAQVRKTTYQLHRLLHHKHLAKRGSFFHILTHLEFVLLIKIPVLRQQFFAVCNVGNVIRFLTNINQTFTYIADDAELLNAFIESAQDYLGRFLYYCAVSNTDALEKLLQNDVVLDCIVQQEHDLQ